MQPFIFNDETKKNSHGFYLLNAGARTERFKDNPVMLHGHDMFQVLGKWNNLRVEGYLMLADPEFDEGDEAAVKIKGKVERGYLKGTSPGIRILNAEYRDNPVTKELDLCVTEWELFEASVLGVPSNAGALLKIYDDAYKPVAEESARLHVENIVKLSLSVKEKSIINANQKVMEIKLTAGAITALGITENADGAAISSAIVALKAKADTAESNYNTLKQKVDEAEKKRVTDMVDLAIQQQKIKADQRENIIALGMANFDGAKAMLDAIPAHVSLSSQVQGIVNDKASIPEARKGWTLLQWMKDDMAGLNKIKTENPDAYKAIPRK